MQEYIVIPIFSDNLLHPLHSDNSLSLLYVKELNKESKILTLNHHDQFGVDIIFIISLWKKHIITMQ